MNNTHQSEADSNQVHEAPIVADGTTDDPSPTFGSNEVRLTAGQWCLVAIVISIFIVAVPRWWIATVPFDQDPDYRVPSMLTEDYWTYWRWIEQQAAAEKTVFLIGDSVIWGEYTTPDATLSHDLGIENPSRSFINGGLAGARPLALNGLIRYYARDVIEHPVILHCNLLWTSSLEQDLQTDKEISFNHQDLVPQLYPRIPCYKANGDQRLGVLVDRMFLLRSWVRHMRIAFFDGQDLQSWSIEHPYDNPLKHIHRNVMQPPDRPHSPPIPWTQRPIVQQDIPWIDLETSYQWHAFRDLVDVLKRRGNRVFVLVGPFNEHMLTAGSRARYRQRLASVTKWLSAQDVPFFAPEPLPTDLYADASHPIAAGYRRLAHELSSQAEFLRWLQAD